MKKTVLSLALAIGLGAVAFAQTKSSGTVTLKSGTALYTVKIDLSKTENLATFTLIGPVNNWLSIGLNDDEMGTGDCVSYNSQLRDQHFVGGHVSPATDSSNNLTLVNVSSDGLYKTVVFTRPLNTGDAKDYAFNYDTLNSLNIIWCQGSSSNQQHITSTYKGSKTLTFTTLGNEDFVSPLMQTTVYPNPSAGIFRLAKANDAEISTIKVFDVNAKLIKEIKPESEESDIQIDLTGMSKGFYFLELSNGADKAVKKIQVN